MADYMNMETLRFQLNEVHDLENLLSPTLAGIGLLFCSFTGLFVFNSAAFLVSAWLILFNVVSTNPYLFLTRLQFSLTGCLQGQHLHLG